MIISTDPPANCQQGLICTSNCVLQIVHGISRIRISIFIKLLFLLIIQANAKYQTWTLSSNNARSNVLWLKVMSPFFVIVDGYFEWRQIGRYRFFNMCFYLHWWLPLNVQLLRVEGWNLINWFNSATFLVPVLSHDLYFRRYMPWSCFVVKELMWRVIVRFVDIDGIVDHCPKVKQFLLHQWHPVHYS